MAREIASRAFALARGQREVDRAAARVRVAETTRM